MKKTFSTFPLTSFRSGQQIQVISQVSPFIHSLANWLRHLGRWALFTSFIVGLFAAKTAHAKLGFMILLPCGLILIALAGYLVKQIKLANVKLRGRDAELFAYVLGGCALIGLIQVLVERFIFSFH